MKWTGWAAKAKDNDGLGQAVTVLSYDRQVSSIAQARRPARPFPPSSRSSLSNKHNASQLSSVNLIWPSISLSLLLHLRPRPSTMPPYDDPLTVHGLDYNSTFLDALPVLRPRPDPHQPIRALTADQFSELHHAHLTTHAPDHVLFPFLHGLEGDNEQQNAFFACSRPKGDVPRFRGLVWVACDEDEDDICDVDDLDTDDDDYSTSSSLDSFGPTDLDEDVAMQLDPTVEGPMVNGCPPPSPLEKLPVARPALPLTASHVPPGASLHTRPSFLTSSFRARELLRIRPDESGSPAHVFVDAKIPDGISLRNFGIQVVSVVLFQHNGHRRTFRAMDIR